MVGRSIRARRDREQWSLAVSHGRRTARGNAPARFARERVFCAGYRAAVCHRYEAARVHTEWNREYTLTSVIPLG